MGKIITDALETNAGTDLVFTVGGSEKMRITAGGKITTTGELSTGGKVTSLVGNQKSEFSQIKSLGNTNSLQVGTNEVNCLTIGQIGGEYSGIGYNVNFDSSVNPPVLKFRGVDTASLLKFHNGGFEFLGTPTQGAAGGTTPITFYSLMTLNKNGLVTIGRVGGPSTSLSVVGGVKVEGGITASSAKIGTHGGAFEWDGQWPQCVMTHAAQRKTFQMTYQINDAQLQDAFGNSGRISALDTIITPRRASSKIRVSFNISGEGNAHNMVFRLYRRIGNLVTEIGAADWANIGTATGTLGTPTYGGNRLQYYGHKSMPYDYNENSTISQILIDYLDSPNTILPVTYFVVIYNANRGIFTLNSTTSDTGNTGSVTENWAYERATSQCILQEFFA